MNREIVMAVQIVEMFRELTGYNTEEFLNYMNSYNVWSILDNKEVLLGCMWADEEDIINLLGRFLTRDERFKIISRYNSRF